MKTFYIFRHGETDWNAAERFQGHIDIPLNDNGRQQAQQLAPTLEHHRIQGILTSDLSRARETAEIAARPLKLALHIDPRLREAHLGGAQGLTRHEIESTYGAELTNRWRSWAATDADVSYPGGEKGSEVLARVLASMRDFARVTEWERIGVATHGGVIRRVMQSLLPAGSEPVPIPNGILYVIAYDLVSDRFSRPA